MGGRSISSARASWLSAGAAAGLCSVALVVSWPGVAMYDSVAQYQQVLSGTYNDWHPPVMARLWSALHPLGPGAGAMFALQMAAYWLGLGLWSAALTQVVRARAGAGMLAIGLCPLFLGWQTIVLKDAQMVGALLAATGLAAWWRLAGRRMPVVAIAATGVLLAYAVLVRNNAVFVVVPLVVMLMPWRLRTRLLAGVGATAIVLVMSPAINHRLLGATVSGVTYAQPIFDLAGIAHFSGAPQSGGLLPEEQALIAARHCYTPFFWDPLDAPAHCGAIAARLGTVPIGQVVAAWARAIAQHPLAYAMHRAGHLNSTWRFLVPRHWTNAAPPEGGEPNSLGLDNPGPARVTLARAGAWVAETPLGWPIVWIVVAGTVLLAARRMAGPARDLALALAVSALALETSFAVISIASDLRYHLWPMIASALALVLMAERGLPRRPLLIGGAVLGLVILGGTAARVVLPPAPASYEAMLG